MILQCVSTVSYKVLQQGKILGPINPSRGLRLGDPLSPYLFILCAEVLSCLIKACVGLGKIHGCMVKQDAPMISHLFFVDDSVLFFKATERKVGTIKSILRTYEMASNQAVNFTKSLIYFSPNTPLTVKISICGSLGVANRGNLGNYLGLPTAIGHNKKEIFKFVRDKVWKRIH